MMPGQDRIIPAHNDSLFFAFFGQLLHDIPPERRGVHHIVIGIGRIKQAEAVVVLGGNDDVFHARFFGQAYPFFGAEL